MSKAKAQGTRHESFLVTELRAAGYEAKRLAEGGSSDEGDVEAFLHGTRWVFEAKARQTLNVQATLGKARKKAGGVPVAVIWKRLVPVAGKQLRQPVEGERIVVSLSLDDFLTALRQAASSQQVGPVGPRGGCPTGWCPTGVAQPSEG